MYLGRRLRHFREMKGLSQKEAAELLELKNYQLANYENDRSEPSIATLKRMSKVYEVSIDGLVANQYRTHMKPLKEDMLDLDDLVKRVNEILEIINNTKSEISE